MILALDTYYTENKAKSVGVLFNWGESEIIKTVIKKIENVANYVSGEFYRRELPCINEVLTEIKIDEIETIIVDGHVYVGNDLSLGLGGYLYMDLKQKTPIIGVAKNSFSKNNEVTNKVFRGNSKKPLYVSSIGMDIDKATDLVKNMKGDYRIPTVLKELDKITRE